MSDAVVDEKGHRWFAAMYDKLSRLAERRQVARLRRELLGDLRGDVLEIGAGTGLNFEHYPAEARVVALEPDPHMLKRAKEKLRPNLELRAGAAESLPFPDASFDAVVSTLVLCTVRDLPQALSEITRVLRPGGKVYFIEHIRAEGFTGRVQDLIRPAWSYFSAGCQVNRRTEGALDQAGLRVTSVKHTKFAPVLPVIYGTAERQQ